METEFFKTLEVGRKYLSRVGKVVKIKSHHENSDYPFKGDNGYTYTAAGFTWVQLKSGHDLISRIIEPTTLTIQRWGVLWKAKDGKIERLAVELGGPKLYRTRSMARCAAKNTVTPPPKWKEPKAVKVKCTYEVIE